MKQTFLLESVMGQNRLAVIEDGVLCELYYERPGLEKLSGNIYVGRVENVLPGMNAAFVDIGLDKNAFLYAGDIQLDTRNDKALADELSRARIEKLVHPGQEILVQVVKEPGGTKGPRISSHITVPGRLMVLLPTMAYAGVSKKIACVETRSRLHRMAADLVEKTKMGVIVRTAAENASQEDIEREFENLKKLWQAISTRGKHFKAPKLIHSDGSLCLRAVRDMLNEDTQEIVADNGEMFEALKGYAAMLAPEWTDRIRLHEGMTPLFDLYRVDTQADKAAGRYVWLKSGGSLVIEETEALTVIDVNTGKFTGKKSLPETIFKINCEAAEEIMRQLRLRDIGGIIIIDFIDMENNTEKQKLLEILKEISKRDRNRTNIGSITPLGLVEVTRKKVRQSMTKQLMHICSACGGNGYAPTYETTARRIVRDVWKRNRSGQSSVLLIEAIEPVIGWVRSIGLPEGVIAYGLKANGIKDWEYTISPADAYDLPDNAKILK
ncbi:MAG: Rne/Rng family ribonuclease [Clostridia bacterium]|nr:Rne/Rng family ribonuclease [Clostridia bacterium]